MKNEESNLVKHARSEFRAAGWVDGDGACDQFEAIGVRVVQPIEDEEDNA